MQLNLNIDYSPDSVTYDTERYTASLSDSEPRWIHTCPLCEQEIFRVDPMHITGNGYTVHESCHKRIVNDFKFYCDPSTDDFDQYVSDEIAEGIRQCDQEVYMRQKRGENIEYYYSK